MKNVVIIGGGAAGMMAAIAAASEGAHVILLEQNEKLGKKVFITGKGRCNLTNDCDTEDLFKNIIRNPKFLYSSIYSFDNQMVMSFFEENGLDIKTERGNRVFPLSDHSSDVISTLVKKINALDVDVKLYTRVDEILVENDEVTSVKTNKGIFKADAVVIATGGVSYVTTGSDGRGFAFVEKLGHTIKPLVPSLVPFETKEAFVKELMGLSLKNVGITILDSKNKIIYEDFGEMLFTHYGVSGPMILSASSIVNDAIQKGSLQLNIDLKPALTKEILDKRLIKEFDENKNRQFKNAVGSLFPGKLREVMVALSNIDENKEVNSITKAEREEFVELIKALPLTLTKLRGFDEAIITRGGVNVKEINPSTMESKIIKGLFFAGEMIDCDALTGGFNLQIAWSTGHLAGTNAALIQ